jgi:hypothetical protein
MKTRIRSRAVSAGLVLLMALLPSAPRRILAQYPFAPPPAIPGPAGPNAQRNAAAIVRNQVGLLQNATHTATSYDTGAVGLLWSQFQSLRGSYNAFTGTLNSQQAAAGANELAELSAGLNIIQEAFSNYQEDVASGRDARAALLDTCQVLNQAAGVWLREFNQDCQSLRVGW